MNQIINILDSFAYRTLVSDIYVEHVSRPATGASSDEQRISAALPKAEVCLSPLSELMDRSPWMTGSAISLAEQRQSTSTSTFDDIHRGPAK
jgi:glutathione S-transferase